MTIQPQKYRWYILALVMLTDMLVVAVPVMGLSMLSKEISQELNLSVVQIGVIWGAISLPAIFTSLFGGMIGDIIGPKRVLVIAALAGGLSSGARGLAAGFVPLVVIAVLHGALIPIVMTNGFKTASQWFPSHLLGRANGLIGMGMALGFLLGAFFSASILSPMLGGWRNVLILYGLLGALLSLPWLFSRTPPAALPSTRAPASTQGALQHVLSLKNVWLLGFGLFGVAGAVQGVLGYLPLFLRESGWQPLHADSAVSLFHMVSLSCILPISLLSDRMASRKRLLLLAAGMIALGTGMLSVASGTGVWAAMLVAGCVRDSFMAIFFTILVETDGVGPTYAGTATGLAMAINAVGNMVAPPLGNSLAAYGPGMPFAFWSALIVFGILCLALTRVRAPVVFRQVKAE